MYPHARELHSKDVENHGTEAMAQPDNYHYSFAYASSLDLVQLRLSRVSRFFAMVGDLMDCALDTLLVSVTYSMDEEPTCNFF